MTTLESIRLPYPDVRGETGRAADGSHLKTRLTLIDTAQERAMATHADLYIGGCGDSGARRARCERVMSAQGR